MLRKMKFILLFLFCNTLFSYQLIENDYFLTAGVGLQTNSIKMQEHLLETPSWQMPIYAQLDFFIDDKISALANGYLSFAGGNIGLGVKPGMKYWFNTSSPLFPYVSLAGNMFFLVPTGIGSLHTNLGLSTAIGLSYFILSDFAAGVKVEANPSVAFISGKTAFELGIATSLDFSFRI